MVTFTLGIWANDGCRRRTLSNIPPALRDTEATTEAVFTSKEARPITIARGSLSAAWGCSRPNGQRARDHPQTFQDPTARLASGFRLPCASVPVLPAGQRLPCMRRVDRLRRGRM